MNKTIFGLIFLLLAGSVLPSFGQDYSCRCPEGYSVVWAGTLVCMGRAKETATCPKGSEFDLGLELCVAEPNDDGLCPDGMDKGIYSERCMSDRVTSLVCPAGGRYDRILSICVVPCGVAMPEKPVEPSAE